MLLDRYDALLLDLDGTVYRGQEAVPGAVEAVAAAREHGTGIRFVTNNASRSPETVAAHLTELGFAAALDEVSTSAQAGAAMLLDLVPQGAHVLVLGTDALAEQVRLRGYRPTRTAEHAQAVVQGLSQDLGWRELAEACVAIRQGGAHWIACNVDATLPTERGLLPGNGSLVAALRTATGVEPLVAGKPATPLLEQAAKSAGAQRPLVVGDRLDTDISGAVNAGMDSLLVLTGVSTEAEVNELPADRRPTYVAADLSVLHRLP
ncbi:HAD-IIA family hydrolase [Saccharothrix sp. 6-C]|uniref:HAD superfamily hydrolase (TIGR01457 family) n=1 Tax=Saccharothrix texasensis TaxID=103734 RepID=A0A3N1HFB6_9PSEU|nr:HAD-IIA family hydrolase [Saccharothrix sp. 6-C]QQQ74733.1 HAD-IIA family hydrolase [Saccharothrix sp. 6-C]ROP41176.1 HAD superfamily hydrolase (TIGR01457 family) [Saccharothrix texasensis]